MDPYFIIFEFGAIFAFLCILHYERKNKRTIEILFLAFVYGIILEAIDIYMSQSYEYSQDFIFRIFGIPLAIGTGWAIVYYLAQNTAQRFNLAWWQSPFLMALIALSYDLSLDAIAIRLGFWKWRISLNEEWFGVPYDNFFGWLAVVWTFGLFINLSLQNFLKPQLQKIIRRAAPIVSSFLLGTEIMLYENFSAVLSRKFTWNQTMAMYNQRNHYYSYVPEVQNAKAHLLVFILIVLLLACLYWAYQNRKSVYGSENKFALYISLSVHFMFIFFLFTAGIYKVSWLLGLVSFSALAFSIILEIFYKKLVVVDNFRSIGILSVKNMNNKR